MNKQGLFRATTWMDSSPAACIARGRGFTLIELMIVIAVIAILAAIALPSYIRYITKTNRKAAEACLTTYANYMERYYTTNLRYDTSSTTPTVANDITKLTFDCASPQQTGPNYQYTTTTLNQTQFILQAAPQGAQATRDTLCGTLTLDQKGTRNINGTGTVATCW